MTTAAGTTVVVAGRPRYEGANIRTWIGFKHFLYLVEEAVVQWFREQGLGPRRLYHELGLGLEIVDVSAVLPALLEIDDEVVADVAETRPGRFAVRLRVVRGEDDVTVLRGSARVALVREADGAAPPPLEIEPLVATDVAAASTAERRDLDLPAADLEAALARRGPRPHVWSWQARYFYCHFSRRVQHSAYVRALEEAVDRFLADRRLSIRDTLDARGWIPVVSRVRVQLVADAYMEEDVHTAFAVTDVLKRSAYDGRMDCWVERAGSLVHTATATILHGYAASRGPNAGRLVELDDATVVALISGGRA